MSISVPVKGELLPPLVRSDILKVIKAKVGIATDNDVVLSGEAATTAIFTVAANTMVHELLMRVNTQFTDSAAITVGDSDDVDGYLNALAAGATDAASAILKSSKTVPSTAIADLNAYDSGKLYAAEQTIDIVAGATFAAGQADVYLVYSLVST